jgi:hypothetical protein
MSSGIAIFDVTGVELPGDSAGRTPSAGTRLYQYRCSSRRVFVCESFGAPPQASMKSPPGPSLVVSNGGDTIKVAQQTAPRRPEIASIDRCADSVRRRVESFSPRLDISVVVRLIDGASSTELVIRHDGMAAGQTRPEGRASVGRLIGIPRPRVASIPGRDQVTLSPFAAEELVNHLKKATDQELPVARENVIPAGYDTSDLVGE